MCESCEKSTKVQYYYVRILGHRWGSNQYRTSDIGDADGDRSTVYTCTGGMRAGRRSISYARTVK